MKKKKRSSFFYVLPQILLDIFCVYISYYMTLVIRISDRSETPWSRIVYMEAFHTIIPWSLLICAIVFLLFRFYRIMWEFASVDELMQIVLGVTVACVLVTLMGYSLLGDNRRFPNSVYLSAWLLAMVLIGGWRLVYRVIHKARRKGQREVPKEEKTRVMVIGAGEMGSMVIKEMHNAPESRSVPVCAIDDDPGQKGIRIHGVKVVGGRDSIPRMVVRYNIDQIVFAIPSVKNSEKQEILSICAKTGCQLKTVPALYEIMEQGEHASYPIRDIDILDLLGRDEVQLNVEEISGYLEGKTVLVTGGGGSIGSELCRQIALFHPQKLIIFDIYENNAYDVQNELLMRHKDLNLEVLIGSVRDKGRVNHIFQVCRPDVVFHAAAHKHVPLMELSPGEAVKNNVFGTLNVAQAANEFGTRRMVLISTDKAVNPTNVMGATKRICELIIQYFSRRSTRTEYAAVRFGNVLGSNGSVIPLFKKQIAAGGPVTITHPEIIRYFMTIPEAARLVIQAGGMAKGGEIFVLDMGEPVKILDLARNMIRLSGFEPDVDIKIEYIGLRPGEKLYEELLLDSEGKCEKTAHDLIYIGSPIAFNEETFLKELEELRGCAGVDNVRMMEIIHQLVPTYSGHAEKNDALAREEAQQAEKVEMTS